MSAKQNLEQFIAAHPDYWEFEEERMEVERLKKLYNDETLKQNILPLQNFPQLQLCV